MAVGGVLANLIEAQTPAEIAELCRGCKGAFRVLGAGSNLLIPDSGIGVPVLRLGRGFRSVTRAEGGSFDVGAAVSLMSLSRDLSAQGWGGLEFAGGIPASIGGAVRMNAGAHGGEIWPLIECVHGVAGHGEPITLAAKEVTYGYRHCSLAADFVITGVRLKLTPSDPQSCAARRAEYLRERKLRQPLTLPSSGSVFRNPSATQSAGALIEQAGLKGFSIGGAQVSELHANWIVNPRRTATSSDIEQVISHCQERVQALAGVGLVPEIVRW